MGQARDLRRRRRLFLIRRRKRAVDATMTVVEHLGELRSRLIWSAAAFVTISIVAFFFYNPLLQFFRDPLCSVPRNMLGPQGCDLIFTRVIGGFQFRLKMTAMVGIAVSSPVWLYHIWAFVVPALTSREKRYAVPFLAVSISLFVIGASTAYLVLPAGIRFLIAISGPGLDPLLGAEEYLNFVGLMLLGFGLLFELPVLLFFLGLAGVFSIEQLRRGRRVAVVVIVTLAAVITPSQDPYTMIVLSVPLYAFYELTILILASVKRRGGSDRAG
jgi:sec-independent protein translocase protein TatC